jgi:hypothetical protein
MSEPELSIVAGALAGTLKPKVTQMQDAIAKRWRMSGLMAPEKPNSDNPDVIPLLAGWIRRLEREAGPDSATQIR